jgi:hypothetical protein
MSAQKPEALGPSRPVRTLFQQFAAATRVRRAANASQDEEKRARVRAGALWYPAEEAKLEFAAAEYSPVPGTRKWDVISLALGGVRPPATLEAHYGGMKRRLQIVEDGPGSGVPVRGGEGNVSADRGEGNNGPGSGMRQPKWSPEEEEKLRRYALQYVAEPGVKKWLSVALELGRTVVGCELHYQKMMRDLRNPPHHKPTPSKRESKEPREKKERKPRAPPLNTHSIPESTRHPLIPRGRQRHAAHSFSQSMQAQNQRARCPCSDWLF